MSEKIAVFCNGFEGIILKVQQVCREKYPEADLELIGYSRRSSDALHNMSDLEDEIQTFHLQVKVLRDASDCFSMVRQSYSAVVVSESLGAKRTLLALIVAVLTRASVLELNLVSSEFRKRTQIGFFSTLLRRLFSRRTLNAVLLQISNRFKLPKLLAYPVNMNVETVAVCNLRCPACATGLNALGRPQGFMDLGKYERMIGECGPFLDNLVLHIYGEPLLHKQIVSFIRSAKNADVKHVEISTNANVKLSEEDAQKLVKSGLDTLIVSMDGASQEVYSQYRVLGKVDMLLDFIKAVVKAKKEAKSLLPRVMVQYIVMKHNVQEIQQARDIVMALGADSFRTKMFDATFADIGLEAALALLPGSDADKFFKLENGKLVSKLATNNNFCHIVWDTATVTWDGHMLPCCYDEKGSMVLGDTFHVDNSFKDVWNSKQFVGFRKAILANRKKIPLCKDCPYV